MTSKIDNNYVGIVLKKTAGIGDDLFEAFFADDEPVTKKPAAAAVTVEATTAAPVEPAKPAVKKTGTKKTSTKKTTTKKTTTSTPPKETETVDKEKPQFPHTPALLELAQHTAGDKDTAEKTSDSTEKLTDSTEKVELLLYHHFK